MFDIAFCAPDMVGRVEGADMDPDEGKGGRWFISYGGGGNPGSLVSRSLPSRGFFESLFFAYLEEWRRTVTWRGLAAGSHTAWSLGVVATKHTRGGCRKTCFATTARWSSYRQTNC